MKRSEIIKKAIATAQQITTNAVNVFTSGEIYPKCYLSTVAENIGGYDRPSERLSPDMRPTELLAYVQGMAAAQSK